jgi:hypothetical protein
MDGHSLSCAVERTAHVCVRIDGMSMCGPGRCVGASDAQHDSEPSSDYHVTTTYKM